MTEEEFNERLNKVTNVERLKWCKAKHAADVRETLEKYPKYQEWGLAYILDEYLAKKEKLYKAIESRLKALGA